jgi:hypothetical protein
MKNKEKYASEIIEIACSGNVVAVSKVTGKPIACEKNDCKNCYRYNDFSFCDEERLKEWAESDYIEKLVISKMDRSFLDYLRDRWKYMARDNISNVVYVFTEIPEKSEVGHFVYTGEARRISSDFNVVFPMVKLSDSEPWLIEDLKKLEVVEEYE